MRYREALKLEKGDRVILTTSKTTAREKEECSNINWMEKEHKSKNIKGKTFIVASVSQFDGWIDLKGCIFAHPYWKFKKV